MTFQQSTAVKIDHDRMVKHIRKIQRQKKIDEWFQKRHERKLEQKRRSASMTLEEFRQEHPIHALIADLFWWIIGTLIRIILYVFYGNLIGRWAWRLYFSFKCLEALLIEQWVMFFVYAAISIFWYVLVELLASYAREKNW